MEGKVKISMTIESNGVKDTYEKGFITSDDIRREDIAALARWALEAMGFSDQALVFVNLDIKDGDTYAIRRY